MLLLCVGIFYRVLFWSSIAVVLLFVIFSQSFTTEIRRDAFLILRCTRPHNNTHLRQQMFFVLQCLAVETTYRSRKTFATFVFCFVLRDIFLPPPPTLSLSPALTILEREKLLLIHFFVYGFKRVPIHCSPFVHSFWWSYDARSPWGPSYTFWPLNWQYRIQNWIKAGIEPPVGNFRIIARKVIDKFSITFL